MFCLNAISVYLNDDEFLESDYIFIDFAIMKIKIN